MYVHWTQDAVTKEELTSIVSNTCSTALIERLMARIARRHGRPRRRLPSSRVYLLEQQPDLSEAA